MSAASDRRRDAATATVGYGLVGAGGIARERGIASAHRILMRRKRMFLPGRSILAARHYAGGRRAALLYGAGSALGLLGAPAATVGTVNLAQRKVHKADSRRSFLAEGTAGTADAFRSKAEGLTNTPPKARAVPIAVGSLAALTGSQAGHKVLDRMERRGVKLAHHLRPAITAAAGTAAAAAALPVASRMQRRVAPGYVVTPTGVKRRKTPPIRPTKRALVVDARPGRGNHGMPTRAQIVPSDQRFGKAYLPELPYDGARWAYHKRHGMCRILAYHGEGRFSVLGKGDVRAVVHRDELSFRKKGPGQGKINKADENQMPHPSDRELYSHLEEHHGLHWKTARDLSSKDWTHATFREYHEGSHISGNDAMRQPLKHTHPHLRIVKRMVRKADYPGRHVSPVQQRAATMAAGAIPIIPFAGPIAAARTAAHYAPPGQRKQAAARQMGSSAASTAAGVAGAYGLAHLSEHNERVAGHAQRVANAPGQAVARFRGREAKQAVVPARLMAHADRKVLKPLLGSPRRAIGALAGYQAGKFVVGQVAQQTAISRNLAAQRRYNAKHKINKAAPPPALTPRDKRKQLQRKKRQFVANAATTALGATGLVLYGTGHVKRVPSALRSHLEHAAIATPILAGGIGTYGGVKGLQIAHRDIQTQEHELHRVGKAMPGWDKRRLIWTYGHRGTRARVIRRLPEAAKNLTRQDPDLPPQNIRAAIRFAEDPVLRPYTPGPAARQARMAFQMAPHHNARRLRHRLPKGERYLLPEPRREYAHREVGKALFHVKPAGVGRRKVYRASTFRRIGSGALVRVRAGLG